MTTRKEDSQQFEAGDDLFQDAALNLHPKVDRSRLSELYAKLMSDRTLSTDSQDALMREARSIAGADRVEQAVADEYEKILVERRR